MCITLLVTTLRCSETLDNFLRLFIHSLRIELLILELFPNLQSILQEIQESLRVSFGLVTNLFTFHSLFHRSDLSFKHAFFHGFGCFAGSDIFFLERHFTVPSSHILCQCIIRYVCNINYNCNFSLDTSYLSHSHSYARKKSRHIIKMVRLEQLSV